MTNELTIRNQNVGSFEEQIGNEFYGVTAKENSSILAGYYALVVVTDAVVEAYRSLADAPQRFCAIDVSRSAGV